MGYNLNIKVNDSVRNIIITILFQISIDIRKNNKKEIESYIFANCLINRTFVILFKKL